MSRDASAGYRADPGLPSGPALNLPPGQALRPTPRAPHEPVNIRRYKRAGRLLRTPAMPKQRALTIPQCVRRRVPAGGPKRDTLPIRVLLLLTPAVHTSQFALPHREKPRACVTSITRVTGCACAECSMSSGPRAANRLQGAGRPRPQQTLPGCCNPRNAIARSASVASLLLRAKQSRCVGRRRRR